MSQSAAAERTLAAFEFADRDAAAVELLRGLAAAVDADPANASLWREYRAAVVMVAALAVVEEDDATILELLRAPMGDAETA